MSKKYTGKLRQVKRDQGKTTILVLQQEVTKEIGHGEFKKVFNVWEDVPTVTEQQNETEKTDELAS